jgi:dipeptidyl aminopeptidase/acylaminoacyl peptidase
MIRLVLALLLLASASHAQTDGVFTVDDVFELEWAESPQISPDGAHVAYVRVSMDRMTDRRRRALWIVGADGRGHRKLTSSESGEGSPRWSPDGTRLAYVASTDQGAEVFVHWVATHQSARLTQLDRSPSGLTWSPDGQQLAFSMLVPTPPPAFDVDLPTPPRGASWADRPRVITRVRHEADGAGHLETGFRHLFVVPSHGGTPRQVTSGDYQHASAPSWLPDGSGLVFSANRSDDWEYTFRESDLYLARLGDTTATAVTRRTGPDYGPAVSPDGERVAYLGFDDRRRTYQNTLLYVRDLAGGPARQLAPDLDRSLSDIAWDAQGRGVYATYLAAGQTHLMHVGLGGEVTELTDALGGTSIGRPYTSGAYSVAQDGTVAFTHGTAYRPADVAVLTDEGVRVLTDLNGDLLAHRTLGQVEEIVWQSPDGRDIQGWIVHPPGFEQGEQYPLLVELHGGPITAYGPQFAAEIQLYAAAGYVVLYANPRGSTGYGEAFADLLYHDFPGGDYDDMMAGIDAAIATGDVDPDHLYVTGGSAGGTLAAWMVGKSDRFRAAVVHKPVVNWISKTLVADNHYGYADTRYPGQPWENPMAYWNESPISVVGDVETPTMLMVGTDDLRTPPSEARQLYHALKMRRVETALVEIPGASHGIASRPSQLADKVAYTLGWFERYRAE